MAKIEVKQLNEQEAKKLFEGVGTDRWILANGQLEAGSGLTQGLSLDCNYLPGNRCAMLDLVAHALTGERVGDVILEIFDPAGSANIIYTETGGFGNSLYDGIRRGAFENQTDIKDNQNATLPPRPKGE